jgi:hypothetical protein
VKKRTRFPTRFPRSGITHEVDPDFLEHLRSEAMEQPELPWEP